MKILNQLLILVVTSYVTTLKIDQQVPMFGCKSFGKNNKRIIPNEISYLWQNFDYAFRINQRIS